MFVLNHLMRAISLLMSCMEQRDRVCPRWQETTSISLSVVQAMPT